MHGSPQLPASIELLEPSDGLLPVHGRGNPVTVLHGERERREEGMEGRGENKSRVGPGDMRREGRRGEKEERLTDTRPHSPSGYNL